MEHKSRLFIFLFDKTMDWTLADILYSDCANSVWLGQYFYCKNFALFMLDKAEK